jgi:serine/threonine protein phosphatase PrpC
MAASDAETLDDFPSLEALENIYFGQPTPPVRVILGARSHTGKVRAANEDHYAVVRRRRERDVLLTNLPAGSLPQTHDEAYVLTVADGIGGAVFGELASQMALRHGWDLTSNAYQWHFKLTDEQSGSISDQIRAYARLIHRKLQQEGRTDPALAGMGTTITCALTSGFDAVIGHVGDSRAYLFRGNSLERLTRDHTLAQEYLDAGVFDSLKDAPAFMRRTLTSCLGGKKEFVQVDTHMVKLRDGDRLLLCTDGLTDMVDETTIANVLSSYSHPPEACWMLVDLALAAGGRDNVTVVLAKFSTADD